MKHKIYLTTGLLLLWQIFATVVDKNVLIPYPLDVLSKMITMLCQKSFYQTIVMTLSHFIIVVILSLIIAYLLAYMCFSYPLIEKYVTPVMTIVQSVPTIAFVFIILVWTSSLQTVYIVLLFVVFPLLFHNFLEGLKNIDRDLKDVIWLYHPPLFERLFRIYFPLIQSSVLSGIKSALSLGVKVSVMAEILSALPYGVGREMNYARIQVDTTELLAWTLWLIVMIMCIEYLFEKVVSYRKE